MLSGVVVLPRRVELTRCIVRSLERSRPLDISCFVDISCFFKIVTARFALRGLVFIIAVRVGLSSAFLIDTQLFEDIARDIFVASRLQRRVVRNRLDDWPTISGQIFSAWHTQAPPTPGCTLSISLLCASTSPTQMRPPSQRHRRARAPHKRQAMALSAWVRRPLRPPFARPLQPIFLLSQTKKQK